MNHPLLMYDMAKLRIADDLRQAERDRLVRQAGNRRPSGRIDSMTFRERVSRLLGIVLPPADDGAALAGA
jgi:hypothetical protein